jgi:hypothetical protein
MEHTVKKTKVVGVVLVAALVGPTGCLLGLAPAAADAAQPPLTRTAQPATRTARPTAGPPAEAGQFTPITVPGGKQVMPQGISDSGVIVGCDEIGSGSRQVGFVGEQGKFTVLSDPASGTTGTTCPFSISNHGVIVGYYDTKTDHGFVYRHGQFTPVNVPGASHAQGGGTFAVDINDSGVIVGRYLTGNGLEHGFVLRAGKFTTIEYPGQRHAQHPDTVLTGISDNGTIVGIYTDENRATISFAYHAGKFTVLAVPHAHTTQAACISAHSGLVVGAYSIKTSGNPTGFSEHAGAYRQLADLAATSGTTATCGNDSGLIVGYYMTQGNAFHGFLFTPAKS